MIDENILVNMLVKSKNYLCGCNQDIIDKVIEVIKIQTKVNEWIPMEERPPKQYTYVLVTCDNGEVDYGFYYDGVWVLDILDSEAYSVIAWQSLPEPYKGSY